MEIKGKEAYEVVYDVIANKSSLIVLQYFILVQKKVYLFSFFVQKAEFDRWELLVSEIAFSLSIL